jgi:hypothetical protein
MTIKPTLQKICKGTLHRDEEGRQSQIMRDLERLKFTKGMDEQMRFGKESNM